MNGITYGAGIGLLAGIGCLIASTFGFPSYDIVGWGVTHYFWNSDLFITGAVLSGASIFAFLLAGSLATG